MLETVEPVYTAYGSEFYGFEVLSVIVSLLILLVAGLFHSPEIELTWVSVSKYSEESRVLRTSQCSVVTEEGYIHLQRP